MQSGRAHHDFLTRIHSPARSPLDATRLRPVLDELYAEYNRTDSAIDPVHVVRRFQDPADREVVGFCAAALAFGRVQSVLRSLERLLAVLGPSPAAFVRSFDPARDRHRFRGLGHRWIRGIDIAALLWLLRQMLDAGGSLERFFSAGCDTASADMSEALESFSTRAMALDVSAAYGRVRKKPGVWYFFPAPSAGSGCKRLNLYLRWMVRRDTVDLGVWSGVSASKLIVPLDTHVIRVGQCLGLTRYRSPGWGMAVDLTATLRALDPSDPVKYDFALCHLGMTGRCGFKLPQADSQCPLRGLCRPVQRRHRASGRPSGRR